MTGPTRVVALAGGSIFAVFAASRSLAPDGDDLADAGGVEIRDVLIARDAGLHTGRLAGCDASGCELDDRRFERRDVAWVYLAPEPAPGAQQPGVAVALAHSAKELHYSVFTDGCHTAPDRAADVICNAEGTFVEGTLQLSEESNGVAFFSPLNPTLRLGYPTPPTYPFELTVRCDHPPTGTSTEGVAYSAVGVSLEPGACEYPDRGCDDYCVAPTLDAVLDGAYEYLRLLGQLPALAERISETLNIARAKDQEIFDLWQKSQQACREYARCQGSDPRPCDTPPSTEVARGGDS